MAGCLRRRANAVPRRQTENGANRRTPISNIEQEMSNVEGQSASIPRHSTFIVRYSILAFFGSWHSHLAPASPLRPHPRPPSPVLRRGSVGVNFQAPRRLPILTGDEAQPEPLQRLGVIQLVGRRQPLAEGFL